MVTFKPKPRILRGLTELRRALLAERPGCCQLADHLLVAVLVGKPLAALEFVPAQKNTGERARGGKQGGNEWPRQAREDHLEGTKSGAGAGAGLA